MASQGRIEHVNLTVSDIERSAAFFEELLGWRQRWRGAAMNGGETIHVGEENSYLALYSDGRDHTGQRKGRARRARARHRAVGSRRLRAGAPVLLLRLGRDRVRGGELLELDLLGRSNLVNRNVAVEEPERGPLLDPGLHVRRLEVR